MKTVKFLAAGLLGAILCATSLHAQDTQDMYELKFRAICQSAQGSKNFAKERISDSDLVQQVADQTGIADTHSLTLVYHVNADTHGDAIQVVNTTNGAVVGDAFDLYFSQIITNSSGNKDEILQYSFVYDYQRSDAAGGATVTKRISYNPDGTPRNTNIRGSIDYFLLPDENNDLRICSGTFSAGKPFVPSPPKSGHQNRSGRNRRH